MSLAKPHLSRRHRIGVVHSSLVVEEFLEAGEFSGADLSVEKSGSCEIKSYGRSISAYWL